MNLASLLGFLPQALLTGYAAVLGIWLKMPWPALAALGLLSLVNVSVSRSRQASVWAPVLAWGCTLVVAGYVLTNGWTYFGEADAAQLGLCNACALLLTSCQLTALPARRRFKILAFTWAFAVALGALSQGYSQNIAGAFYFGLVTALCLLIFCQLLFRLRPFAIQSANTLILLLIGLPMIDWWVRPPFREPAQIDPRKKPYLYENAKKDPGAFAVWQESYPRSVGITMRHLCKVSRVEDVPWPLKPGSRWPLFDCEISINSNGFRGHEIAQPKGDTYRIVALGESTTFGITLTPEDRPWPELLERLIQQRLKPNRPVEVINAGVPGYGLRKNLARLASDILPLKPDMIISYHGHNGFVWVQRALPFGFVKAPPAYVFRPLKLLADCEYHLKILWYDYHSARLKFISPAPGELLATDYARAYQELVSFAQTNSIRLVLATYSMAVNQQSDRRLIEFYRPSYPRVYWDIKANEVHSRIVKQLAVQHPEIRLVDTHPGLDGQHDDFIDLVHFSPEGEQQMAETFFAALKPVLAQDLVRTNTANTNAAPP